MDIYVIEETNSREKDFKWHEMCYYLITDVGRSGVFMQHKITVWFIAMYKKLATFYCRMSEWFWIRVALS